MRSSLLLALAAGAVCAPALAAEDVARPETNVIQVPDSAYVGQIRPAVRPAAEGLVVDNSTGGTFSNTANPNWAIDDWSLSPGSATPAPQLITGISFGFAIRGTTGSTRSFDVLVEFLDTYNSAAPVGSPAWTGTLGNVVRVQFVNLNQNTAYTTALLDLSGLPGGGIQTFDRGFGVDIKFVEPGTTTLIVAPEIAVTHLLNSNTEASGANTLTNGSGSFPLWRDAGNTAGVIEAADARNFAFPTHARYYLKLEGQTFCPADFNKDGQIDFFDYLDFVGAFDIPCE